MKWLAAILLILLLALQYRLWVGEGSVAHMVRLERAIAAQQEENSQLRERNRVLMLEVQALKSGLASIEDRAREDMGMIKPGETFFMVIEPKPQSP